MFWLKIRSVAWMEVDRGPVLSRGVRNLTMLVSVEPYTGVSVALVF